MFLKRGWDGGSHLETGLGKPPGSGIRGRKYKYYR